MKNQNTNIRKMKKPLNINIGMVLFVAIFVYVIICVVLYFNTNHIIRYEVKEGSLAVSNIYEGLILREEIPYYAQSAGYTMLYPSEGDRVAVGDMVYTIDETGRLDDYLESCNFDSSFLSQKELTAMRCDMTDFMHSFTDAEYSRVYQFKTELTDTVVKLASNRMLENLKNAESTSDLNGTIEYFSAPKTGNVAYWRDGFEEFTPDMITEECFDKKEYSKQPVLANSLLAGGDFVYKVCGNEEWSLMLPMEEERASELLREEYVKVKFLKNQYISWGQVFVHHNGDGKCYVELKFNNSCVTFISERFLEVEIILHDDTGLKIPISSIVEKEFYLVPAEYVITDEALNKNMVTIQAFDEDGQAYKKNLSIDIFGYLEAENSYYIDDTLLNTGDILYMQDSQEMYIVGKTAKLIGVYNMNKGYADFKQINKLYENQEYAIVSPNSRYGLNVYDFIVLNADSVEDDQLIKD